VASNFVTEGGQTVVILHLNSLVLSNGLSRSVKRGMRTLTDVRRVECSTCTIVSRELRLGLCMRIYDGLCWNLEVLWE